MSNKLHHLYGKNYLSFEEEKGRIAAVFGNTYSDDCFLMSIEAFYGMEEELFRIFGMDYALIEQKAGEGAGRVSARSFPKETEQIAEAIKNGFNGISRWGFGRYQLKELDIKNMYVVFELHDSIFEYYGENDKYRRFAEEPHFLIGFYKGFFSAVFGRNVYCNFSLINDNGKPHYKFELNAEFEEIDVPIEISAKSNSNQSPLFSKLHNLNANFG
jgi:hypothetical protein